MGAASLKFSELPAGYSDYESKLNVAWGADVRFGYPVQAAPYQVIAAIKYFGFMPKGTTSSEQKTIESEYQWHEISPTLIGGYALGSFVPYLGVTKPYLFGKKTEKVTFNQQEFPAAGGETTYSDGEQSIRPLFGLEWRGAQGYSITGEAASGSDGMWTFSIGVSQVLK